MTREKLEIYVGDNPVRALMAAMMVALFGLLGGVALIAVAIEDSSGQWKSLWIPGLTILVVLPAALVAWSCFVGYVRGRARLPILPSWSCMLWAYLLNVLVLLLAALAMMGWAMMTNDGPAMPMEWLTVLGSFLLGAAFNGGWVPALAGLGLGISQIIAHQMVKRGKWELVPQAVPSQGLPQPLNWAVPTAATQAPPMATFAPPVPAAAPPAAIMAPAPDVASPSNQPPPPDTPDARDSPEGRP